MDVGKQLRLGFNAGQDVVEGCTKNCKQESLAPFEYLVITPAKEKVFTEPA